MIRSRDHIWFPIVFEKCLENTFRPWIDMNLISHLPRFGRNCFRIYLSSEERCYWTPNLQTNWFQVVFQPNHFVTKSLKYKYIISLCLCRLFTWVYDLSVYFFWCHCIFNRISPLTFSFFFGTSLNHRSWTCPSANSAQLKVNCPICSSLVILSWSNTSTWKIPLGSPMSMVKNWFHSGFNDFETTLLSKVLSNTWTLT